MNVFRMKTIAYVIVSLFVLTQICVLSSAIAECGISDIDAANAELDRLYDEQEEADRELQAAVRAYDNYVDTILTQYIVGIGTPAFVGLLSSGIKGLTIGVLIGGIVTTVKIAIDASNLMEKIRVARSKYESVSQQVRDLEDKIFLYETTHDDDDQENNNQNNNDDGCNDS